LNGSEGALTYPAAAWATVIKLRIHFRPHPAYDTATRDCVAEQRQAVPESRQIVQALDAWMCEEG
jgi:hypothetical protein